jgi:bifunctional DNase/RNase
MRHYYRYFNRLPLVRVCTRAMRPVDHFLASTGIFVFFCCILNLFSPTLSHAKSKTPIRHAATIYEMVHLSDNHFAILLQLDNEQMVPIILSPHEAMTLSMKMSRQQTSRPMTIDLLEQVLDVSDVSIEKVVIEDIIDQVYLARIHLKFKSGKKTKHRTMDVRPSDGLALAMAYTAPLFVAEKLLKKLRKVIGPQTEQTDSTQHQQLSTLPSQGLKL